MADSNSSSKETSERLHILCDEFRRNSKIATDDYVRFNVKRGLRNYDGTGVKAGLTNICSVEGYYMDDGERIPKEGKLFYRGISIEDIVNSCIEENRFGFEEVVWLLLFGSLPTQKNIEVFSNVLSSMRELPDDFAEDMIMKAPSPNIMNKLARSVLALYSYDKNPDDNSIENMMRQSISLIAQIPIIMAYAYQVKRRHYYRKSMYIHMPKPHHSTAEVILNSIRSDKQFSDEEAKLLDICLMLHAEHGGGNNSTFATRVLSSSGTDTYSAIAAGIGSLKGPKHGGANLKVSEMIGYFKENVSDITNSDAVTDYLYKIMKKQAGDKSGLVYGMGHAVYTLSDPRAKILKEQARKFSQGTEFENSFKLLDLIEKNTPEIFANVTGNSKKICANVDLYSGLIYEMLRIPQDLYTPLFATARMAGWCAHRLEEVYTGNRIIRPAYKSMTIHSEYIPLSQRKEPVAPEYRIEKAPDYE